jgi:predicted HicB family RNase H-like nuclease
LGNCLGSESEAWGMPRGEAVAWDQLATRIPKSLHRALKLRCVTVGTSVMDFVTKAIEEKLARSRGAPAKRRRVKA